MTIEEIRELIQTVVTSGVAELEVQRGENRVWIKRTGGALNQEITVSAAHVAESVSPAHAPAVPAAVPPAAAPDAADAALTPVKSPIVGTFYESSSPGSEPFVKVGDVIRPGKVLCIIESMKLMNEIESEVSGTVARRLVENGQPVEFGETLYLVKPS
jgi:acetyl-CoA carboxylase biotin carboxyl carrier protein